MASGRRTLRLQSRVTLFFSLTALATTVALAVVTYAIARRFLVDQRASVARTQAFSNAKVVNDQLTTKPAVVGDVVARLRTEGDGFALLTLPEGEFLSDNRFPASAVPAGLVRLVGEHTSGQQFYALDGRPYLAVGVYLAGFDATYIEAFPLADTERTLRAIATAMAVGALATTILAAGFGRAVSRRVLQPLSQLSTAAGQIASGGLDSRMPDQPDPDLSPLVTSFNDMADAVQARIEREERFASDVSHELRSPITALAAAVDVLDGRRAELSDRGQQALEVVVTQVHRFDQMVLDLLELSRLDAGANEVHREPVDVGALIARITHRYGFGDVARTIDPRLTAPVAVDKLRVERILANLLDNALHHAGGPVEVRATPAGATGVQLTVCDAGPGVAPADRLRIYERFARGSTARHRSGTGLGLALVAEHAAAHGGRAWVDDRDGGGACFHVVLEDAR